MERVYSAEQIKAALASGRKDDIEEVREAMQQLIAAKEDSKTTASDVKVIIYADPDSLMKVEDGTGTMPPIEAEERKVKIMSSAAVQQQSKLQEQGKRFAAELAAVGGLDPSKVAKNLAYLFTNMDNAMQTLIKGRAQLAVAEPNRLQTVEKVRKNIFEDTENRSNGPMVVVKRNFLRDKSAYEGIVASLPARPEGVSDAVLLDKKIDLTALIEKNPKDIYKKALELGQIAAAAHDSIVLYVLCGGDMMAHVFQRLLGDIQAKELREKLFAILADSYLEKHALALFPEIEIAITECERIIKLELRELQKEA